MLARSMITGKALGPLLIATGLLVAGLGVTGWQLLETREALGECRGDRRSHIETATTNAEAVQVVRERLAQCLAEQGADLRAQAEASEIHAREVARIAGQLARERQERDRLNELDECEEWRTVAVCGPIADRLRDTATRPPGGGS